MTAATEPIDFRDWGSSFGDGTPIPAEYITFIKTQSSYTMVVDFTGTDLTFHDYNALFWALRPTTGDRTLLHLQEGVVYTIAINADFYGGEPGLNFSDGDKNTKYFYPVKRTTPAGDTEYLYTVYTNDEDLKDFSQFLWARFRFPQIPAEYKKLTFAVRSMSITATPANLVTLGGRELSRIYGVDVTSVQISPPEAKTVYVDVPGRDGSLDLTELFGAVRYNPREIVINGIIRGSYEAYVTALSALANDVDGQRLPLKLGRDADHEYQGRWTVASEKQDACSASVTITGLCDPYKYKRAVTEASFSVAGSQAITLANERMPVAPTVTTDAELQVAFGGSTYVFAAGTHTAPGLILAEGDNALTVTGTGTITFRYQEGSL